MTSQRTRDRLVNRLRDNGIRNEKVLKAITTTPRHEFIDEALSSRAYEDTALPIGQSQTISQPWVVARMTEALLECGKVEKVLEVGTGSGYQAAILAVLVPKVFTVERIEELLKQARRRFHKLGLHNIFTRYADGHLGWPSQAPFRRYRGHCCGPGGSRGAAGTIACWRGDGCTCRAAGHAEADRHTANRRWF